MKKSILRKSAYLHGRRTVYGKSVARKLYHLARHEARHKARYGW